MRPVGSEGAVAKTLTRKTQTNMTSYVGYEDQCGNLIAVGGVGVKSLQSFYFDTERNLCDYNEIVKSQKPRNFGGQTDCLKMGDGEAQTI